MGFSMTKLFCLSFSLLLTLPALAQKYSQPSDCRSHIAQIVCLVEPADPSTPESGYLNRPCKPGGENYQSYFERHYDRSPDVIKNMYCHLGKIFVETSFQGTAYASQLVDANGKMTGGAIGIRKEVLDNPLTYPQWLSWKEETSFGGSTTVTGPSLNLIHYQANINTHDLFLDFVIAHEFGHLFDFTNRLNQLADCRWEDDDHGGHLVGSCTPMAGSWTVLSWQGPGSPTPANDYPLRKETCFYFCNGHYLPEAGSTAMFSGLLGSNFVSTYAASNMSDDWAETFAYYTMIQARGFQLYVETHGNVFDLTGHFASDLLVSKRAYVTAFLQSPFLYPGEGNVTPTSQITIIDR